MDNELLTTQKTDVEEAFDNIPEEVLQFMLSNAFELLIDAIQHALSLTDEQKKLLKTGAYALLIRLKSADLVYEDFLNAGIDEELASKMVFALNTEIVERAINISTFYADDPNESNEEEGEHTSPVIPAQEVKNAPSPEDILATLEEQLTKSKVVTPSTRTYSAPAPSSTPSDAPAPTRRSIDPYRELPEN